MMDQSSASFVSVMLSVEVAEMDHFQLVMLLDRLCVVLHACSN